MPDTILNTSVSLTSLWWTLGIIALFVFLLILLLRSGRGYSVHDTEAHSTSYAGIVKEGHGGLTAFLWVLFISIIIWSIVYFILHRAEYAIVFAH